MKGIRHTGIVVTDIEKSLYFYQDLLGLKIARKMDESGEYIDKILAVENVKVKTVKLAADDGNLIELLYYHSCRGKKLMPRQRGICEIGISHVAFTVKNLDAEYKRLMDTGVQFNSSPQISLDGYVKVVFCKDPDGNFIELVEVL